jgi:hypothetical protein
MSIFLILLRTEIFLSFPSPFGRIDTSQDNGLLRLCLSIRRRQSGIASGYPVLLGEIVPCSDILLLLLRLRRNLDKRAIIVI